MSNGNIGVEFHPNVPGEGIDANFPPTSGGILRVTYRAIDNLGNPRTAPQALQWSANDLDQAYPPGALPFGGGPPAGNPGERLQGQGKPFLQVSIQRHWDNAYLLDIVPGGSWGNPNEFHMVAPRAAPVLADVYMTDSCDPADGAFWMNRYPQSYTPYGNPGINTFRFIYEGLYLLDLPCDFNAHAAGINHPNAGAGDVLGMTYKQTRLGFTVTFYDANFMDMQGLVPGAWNAPAGPVKVTQSRISISSPWDEPYNIHTGFPAGVNLDTFGDGVWLQQGAIQPVTFVAGAIDNVAIASNAIDSDAIATDAIGPDEIRDGAITEPKFGDNAISARVIADGAIDEPTFVTDAISERVMAPDSVSANQIATDAIDADAIAEAAIGAMELDTLAAVEIADAVWNRSVNAPPQGLPSSTISDYEDPSQGDTLGTRLAKLTRLFLHQGKDPQATATIEAVNNAVSPNGKFYGDPVHMVGPVDNKEYTQLIATLRNGHDVNQPNQTTACRIVAVAADGNGDYFQLERITDGSLDIEVGAGDRLTISNMTAININDIFEEPLADHMTDGTIGDVLLRTLGLRQQNMQIKYTAHNVAGVPTAGTIYIYESAAQMAADPNITGATAFGSYAFTADFDPNDLKPLDYKSTKTS